MLWSPTIRAALLAGTPWLDVFCPGCATSRAIDLRTKVALHRTRTSERPARPQAGRLLRAVGGSANVPTAMSMRGGRGPVVTAADVAAPPEAWRPAPQPPRSPGRPPSKPFGDTSVFSRLPISMVAGSDALAIATPEIVHAGKRVIKVVHVWITDVGRQAIPW
jgi:hypothetical protein